MSGCSAPFGGSGGNAASNDDSSGDGSSLVAFVNQIGDVAASLDFVFGYGCGSIGFGDIGSSFLGSDGGSDGHAPDAAVVATLAAAS
jgi:hypothetical protein